jgi:TonB-dependent SusC/RagA subfamily outer membrane receptor
MKRIVLLVIYTFLCVVAQAQVPDYTTTKEKVYLQTNHVYMEPGDTLYYKAYVVNALDNTPTSTSTILNVDIINPSGTTLKQLKHPITNGYCEGGFPFAQEVPGGIYKIRAYTTWMQNETDSTWFTKAIVLQRTIAARLLLKLEFPEKGYGPGDTITAKFEARTTDNVPISNTTGDFVISIDGKQQQAGSFRTGNDGKGIVRAVLPDTLATPDGLLTVKMSMGGYTESVSRSIPIVLNNIDLQFLPEGGTFVGGLQTILAFKAVNEYGKPADVKGVITDSKGVKVATFASYHGGMGILTFTPVAGSKYYAQVTTPVNISKRYELPVAVAQGIVLNFVRNKGQLYARISSTSTEDITLTATVREQVYYTTNAALQSGIQYIKIDTADYPAGIVKFTLRNSHRLKVAERVIFVNKYSGLQVKIATDKPTYQPRERVKMTITTTDANDQPLPANMSLSVIDDKLWTMADDKQDHILSWLLMSTELHGKVEEPQFYFKRDEPKSDSALDMLMLTQGYRYFAFTDAVTSGNKLSYLPDRINILSGTITDKKGSPVPGTIYLLNASRQVGIVQAVTGSGQFFFSDLDPGVKYELLAAGEHAKDSLVINIAQNGIGFNKEFASLFKPLKTGMKELIAGYPAVAMNEPYTDGFNKDAKGLNEVVVVGFGNTRSGLFTGSRTIIIAREYPGTGDLAGTLAGKVAGVYIQPNPATPAGPVNVLIRGQNSIHPNTAPLFVVDGVPMAGNILNQLNPNDIESLTILTGGEATALYGSKAANGVVLISVKNRQQIGKLRFRIGKTYHYGLQSLTTPSMDQYFSQVPVFYAPTYTSTVTDTRNDFRETIYWNPTVQTDRYGKASIEFYNSDASTTFRAITEGIGYNGIVGRMEHTYASHDAISVDAKIPPYISVGDTIRIPLVLKNYTDTDKQVHIDVKLPAGVKGWELKQDVVLKKNGHAQLYIPLAVLKAVKGQIRIDVNQQAVSLPFTAEEKHFPMHVMITGNRSLDTTFSISQPVPGSIQTAVKLHLAQDHILDGMAGMLREPHGCFEQTSSTTYPNILILQLLKAAGKQDKALEQKARMLLESGYDKLIKFETPEDGFEWFGRAPAHVALTAYGLLEFTAMQQFIKVDEQLLQRTKKFLLNHRDGHGGFKRSVGGYDEFRAVPEEIASTYIVYALSTCGAGNEITPEFDAALKAARSSNDGYQLAMMALAADKMQRKEDFIDLMGRLDKLYQDGTLPALTSYVNSKGLSLYVETMSLYAMALMREAAPRRAIITPVINAILSKKTYYGFGSTQGTVQALSALAAYADLERSSSDTSKAVTFTLDDVKEGINTFKAEYKQGHGVTYTMECNYFTYTPPVVAQALIHLQTSLGKRIAKVGETVRMDIQVQNISTEPQAMTIAKIGIPAGLSMQTWQLKELMEQNKVAYYEIFDNYLVFYWRGMAAQEVRKINLDLKAEVPGSYQGKAGVSYLYYVAEDKYWVPGETIKINP